MKLSIVIPCYNEGLNIESIIHRLCETARDRGDIEVILVDNGSSDNTQELMEKFLHGVDFIKSVYVPVNQGYGYGILQGLNAAAGDVLSWTHADMQTDPKDVLTAFDLYKQYEGEKIIIKGKRKKRKLLEAFFTFGMQVFASIALKVRLDDVNAQPKVFSRSFYSQYVEKNAPHDFSLDLYLLYQARKQNYTIVEIPVFFKKRQYGEAKGGGNWKTRIKLIRRTFAYIWKLRDDLKKQR